MNPMLTQQVVPISDFRIHQSKTLEKMASGPLYLAQRSKPIAVLVAADQWDQTMLRLQALEKMFARQKVNHQLTGMKNSNAPSDMALTEEKQQVGLITLPENLLAQIDQFTGVEQDLSAFIEAATRQYITKISRVQQNARDVDIINEKAEYLNSEAMDVLEYQAAI